MRDWSAMLAIIFEVAAQIGHLPTEGSIAPRCISKKPDFGMREETPSAEAALALKEISKEDHDFENCTKLAALAGIRLPVLGDHYSTTTEEVLVYQTIDLSTIARKLEPGKIFGPIVDYSCYEETLELSPTRSEFHAGILVAFDDEAVDKTSGLSFSYRAFVNITRNGEQICVPSSGPAKSFLLD